MHYKSPFSIACQLFHYPLGPAQESRRTARPPPWRRCPTVDDAAGTPMINILQGGAPQLES